MTNDQKLYRGVIFDIEPSAAATNEAGEQTLNLRAGALRRAIPVSRAVSWFMSNGAPEKLAMKLVAEARNNGKGKHV